MPLVLNKCQSTANAFETLLPLNFSTYQQQFLVETQHTLHIRNNTLQKNDKLSPKVQKSKQNKLAQSSIKAQHASHSLYLEYVATTVICFSLA
jgi:ATP/ADP translocase